MREKPITILQVVDASFYGPIYKEILPNIHSLPPVPNIQNHTQLLRLFKPVAFSSSGPFPRVGFKMFA